MLFCKFIAKLSFVRTAYFKNLWRDPDANSDSFWPDGMVRKSDARGLSDALSAAGASYQYFDGHCLLRLHFGLLSLLKQRQVLASQKTFRFFMAWQCLGQLLMGNFVCAFLAFCGSYQARHINSTQKTNPELQGLTIMLTCLYLICFGFLVTILIHSL